MPSFLTVDEVAEILRLNRRTVENWIKSGKLSALRFGRKGIRIERAEVERFVNGAARAA
jgi:excisionase family DNA binding protein